ncbi:hypothetical protein Tco_1085055 [Tanacetum coccineum]
MVRLLAVVARGSDETKMMVAVVWAAMVTMRWRPGFWEKIKLLMQGTSVTNARTEYATEQFSVNTKFLNTLPGEWSKFVYAVFQKGDDLIDAINHMMSFFTVVVTSRYPTTNNSDEEIVLTLGNKLPSIMEE